MPGSPEPPDGPLLVIVPDRLSDLIAKGEVSPRYYNPGGLFREVHLLLSNDDHPDRAALEHLTGTTEVHVHNVPAGRLTAIAASVHPGLASRWTSQVVDVARTVRPRLIRCYAPYLNAVGARAARLALGIPYVVSIHGLPDPVALGSAATPKGRVAGLVQRRLAAQALEHASATVAVYQSLLPWLATLPGPPAQVAYNVVCPDLTRPACPSPRIDRPLRVLSVGRQIPGKDPTRLLQAAAQVPDVELTLIGDGPLHAGLSSSAAARAAADRIHFVRAVPNGDLCTLLADYDAFALHNDYPGIPKTALEAMLAGLPVISNRPARGTSPELEGEGCLVVDDTVDDYRRAFTELLDDDHRVAVASRALERAWSSWSPGGCERRYLEIHQRALSTSAPEPQR